MIDRSMSPAHLVADLREDLKQLRDHLDAPVRKLRKEYLRNPNEPLEHLLPWRSPAGNHWLALVRIANDRVSTYTMAWYVGPGGRLYGLWVAPNGVSYVVEPQVIDQYGFSEDPLERLQSFFMENPYYAMQVEEPLGEDRWNVSMALDHGVALGEWDATADVVYVRAFVEHYRLFNGAGLHQRHEAEHFFRSLSLHQRIELADRARAIVQRAQERNAA